MLHGSLSQRFQWIGVIAIGCALAFWVGCSGTPDGPETFPVTGKVVTANGVWTAGGNVEFRAQDSEQNGIAMGQIKPDGTFELGTSTKHGRTVGVRVGKYSVTVTLSDPKDPQLVRTVILPEPVSVIAQDSNQIELTLPE